MDEKCKKDIKKVIKQLEFAMEESDAWKILLTLKEVQGIFTEVWKKYIDYVLYSDKK